MSADELAEKLGVSRSTIFRYEKGDIDKVPADHVIQKLHKLFAMYIFKHLNNFFLVIHVNPSQHSKHLFLFIKLYHVFITI